MADGLNISPLTAVATAAVREADDGPDFCAEVERHTGLKLWVIDGQEEARLSAQGVLLGWPGSYGMVCDIGGSSMELADLQDGKVGRRLSSALGPLKLREVKGGKKGVKRHIAAIMEDLHEQMGGVTGQRLFLVGGSWRAIARIDMERRDYPLHVLHEYRMRASSVSKTLKFIAENDPTELRARCGVSSTRMDLVPLAILVLRELVKRFKPKDIAVSSYGIREGMLYEQMPQKLRDRDPLIEACRFAEMKDARIPGFGRRLYDFVQPLFPRAGWQKKRLIKAATLLHDVSWRAHPDYRHEVVFDNATRANLGGLKHEERVFLGMALLHRYSNRREDTRFEELFSLLDARDQHDAEVLGRTMRLGAMLWTDANGAPAKLMLSPKKNRLTLTLAPEAEPMFGEVAEARFTALAGVLGVDPVVRQRR